MDSRTTGGATQSPVIQGSDGNFYGTAFAGGSHGLGTVFRVTPDGVITTLHNFCSQTNCADGFNPIGGLVQGNDGNFYGTTSQGGAHVFGTVFVISASGSFNVLHSFDGSDGSNPWAGLLKGSDGNFYGTTVLNGANHAGTLFKITPTGELTTVYAFGQQLSDGAGSRGVLAYGPDGNFYGTTFTGGTHDNCTGGAFCGTVFKVTPQGVYTTLYNFCPQPGCVDGSFPSAGLVLASDGNFYGTTWTGGANNNCNPNCGTIFRITPGGTFTSLYSFCTQSNCSDGKNPFLGTLVQASDGNLYGTTWLGGSQAGNCAGNGCGTIFRIALDGHFTTLHAFNFTDGDLPYAGMIQASDGNLYGTTSVGGAHDGGTVYRFNPGIPPNPVQLVPLAPCRVVDTRNPNGDFGGPVMQGNTSRSFELPQGPCPDIPPSAAAYSLNVTVVPRGRLGYLTIWPTGQSRPVVSTMNSADGRVKANAAIVPAGTNAAISVYVTDTTDVILDINGYFASPPAQTYQFHPHDPCRVVDTRNPDGHLGGPRLEALVERDFPVLESPCLNDLPPQPAAYSFNMTVAPNPVNHPLGYLTVWPAGGPRPIVSTLNNVTGTFVANAAVVPAGTNGAVAVYASDSTDLIIDINGYFSSGGSGGLSLYPVSPCRVLDTRDNHGQPFTGERTVDVVGSPCAPSVNAQAYVFNATVVPSPTLGFLTLWPNGQDQPLVSTLNAADGWVTSNMAIVPTTNGLIDAYAQGMTHLILDISGYFAP